MFKSLDEVKTRWQERYQETGQDWNLLPSPGHSETEIVELEQVLGVKIHSSFRWILCDVNLDTVGFGHHCLSNGVSMLQSLRGRNWDMILNTQSEDLKQGFLTTTWTEFHIIVINNSTGEVYEYDHEWPSDTKVPVANNMEEYICIAASIDDYEWPDSIDINRLSVKTAISCVDALGIEQGREFWTYFVRGVA